MPGRPIRHRTAAKWTLKTASTAEEKGSEPSVCRSGQTRLSRERRFPRGGTEGSNSAFSSAESATNLVAAGGVARGWAQSSNPLCSSGESTANLTPSIRVSNGEFTVDTIKELGREGEKRKASGSASIAASISKLLVSGNRCALSTEAAGR
jgi:hypothetical protein